VPDDTIPANSIQDDPIQDNSTPEDSSPGDSARKAPTPDAPRPVAPGRVAFPLGKLVISVVGIAVAAWVWLGSGWRWDVTPGDLAEGKPPAGLSAWPGRYVRLVGARDSGRPPVEHPGGKGAFHAYADAEGRSVLVRLATDGASRAGSPTGRVMGLFSDEKDRRAVVDTMRDRLDARAVMAVVIVLWGLAHAGANIWVWRQRCATTPKR